MFASLADYLADPDVKASIDAEIENQTDDSMTIKVYADGNALVYEYQFTDEYDLSDEDIKQSVLDALKEGCEENASTFEEYRRYARKRSRSLRCARPPRLLERRRQRNLHPRL